MRRTVRGFSGLKVCDYCTCNYLYIYIINFLNLLQYCGLMFLCVYHCVAPCASTSVSSHSSK